MQHTNTYEALRDRWESILSEASSCDTGGSDDYSQEASEWARAGADLGMTRQEVAATLRQEGPGWITEWDHPRETQQMSLDALIKAIETT